MADDPVPQSAAEAEAQARNRFLFLNLMRLGGVIMVVIGIAIAREAIALPAPVGWLLIALGLVEMLVVPQMLVRIWRSERPK